MSPTPRPSSTATWPGSADERWPARVRCANAASVNSQTPAPGALILAGGRGERFWPWSTAERPKQLLPLAPDGRTLLAATFSRARRIAEASRIIVMTAETLVEACRRECPGAIVVGEP